MRALLLNEVLLVVGFNYYCNHSQFGDCSLIAETIVKYNQSSKFNLIALSGSGTIHVDLVKKEHVSSV